MSDKKAVKQITEVPEARFELGELPDGWTSSTLRDVIKTIEAGKSFQCDERTPRLDEIGVLKVSAVTWQIFNETESKTVIDKEKINKSYLVKSGDFFFSRANTLELIGAVVLVNSIQRKLMLSDKTLRFIFHPSVRQKYILYYLRSRRGRKEIQRLSTGNQESMRNIGQERIKQIEFPLCSLPEQDRIIEELESKLTICDEIEETIESSLQQAETLKQSILKRAFEGRLITVEEKPIYKPKNVYFYQMQLLGYVLKISKEKKIGHGEMTTAKYMYLIEKLYGVPTYYEYKRWHLGPYPPEMKKAIKNKKFFGVEGTELKVTDEKTLFKYSNPYEQQVANGLNELTDIFSEYDKKDRAHHTELLATVCKVIEDIKSTNLQEVRQSMKEWKIDLKTTKFKNKAEKFTEQEAKECLKMIILKGWDEKLVS